MDIGIASIIVSLIIAAGGIVASIIFSFVPRQRKEKIRKLQKELYDVYTGVVQLKILEETLEQKMGISKQSARKGFNVPDRFENSKLKKRINQLENLL